MEFDVFKKALQGAVAFYDGEQKKNPIRGCRTITKDMKVVAGSCHTIAATFKSYRTSRIPAPDWKVIPPCF